MSILSPKVIYLTLITYSIILSPHHPTSQSKNPHHQILKRTTIFIYYVHIYGKELLHVNRPIKNTVNFIVEQL